MKTIFYKLLILSSVILVCGILNTINARADVFTPWQLESTESWCEYHPYYNHQRGTRKTKYYYIRYGMRDDGSRYLQRRSETKVVGRGGAVGCPMK